jgi:hypothetical protein
MVFINHPTYVFSNNITKWFDLEPFLAENGLIYDQKLHFCIEKQGITDASK